MSADAAAVSALAQHQNRFLIFSRQRSASTTLARLLDEHPQVTCLLELLNAGGPKVQFLSHQLVAPAAKQVDMTGLRAALNVSSHSDAMADLPRVMARFWDWCPHKTCGFKIFDDHLRAPASLQDLLGRVPKRPLKLIVLERNNVTAEYLSWQKAVSTGHWRTPQEQNELFGHHRVTGTVPMPAYAAKVTLQEFAAKHAAWFAEVAKLSNRAPMLRLLSEDIIRDTQGLEQTRARVYRFLGLTNHSRHSH